MNKPTDDEMAEQLDNLTLLGEAEEDEEPNAPTTAEDGDGDEGEVIPDMDDIRWTEYVMKQFNQSTEMYDGYPVVDGLRRVATKLLGPIISSKPRTVQAPTSANGFCATVEWELTILWERDDELKPHQRVFGDVADVNPNNTEHPFCLHAAACAATKAEGRALRKALMLSRIHTAEEMMDAPEDTGDSGRKITDSQMTFLTMKGHDLDINIGKMLEATAKKNNYPSIKDIPYHKAVLMFNWICQVQQGVKTIPAEMKGFDPEWRKTLGV